ncbi:hypothetical protein PENANT_c046G11203 [Penicillium antarcticum]|uniref:Uncharacterized protein n=1 Tax=Penicillium antarcticum TaxID=416450 RepID=A0A1V6PSF4_9EURO|nr:uncharacterized protein N7508_006815 [Penicillium antarcticum]KAJ5301952.1 hypothetical protein N7508_006815 [Penicillium antarcticum]OQD79637.1 hypothetical protein PENANT_c046G11203 [Penicillium antarcticum]
MIVPKPQVTLEGDCSTIYSNTLYVFSRGDLLSIPLRENGNWTEQPKGTSVTGAACVKSDDAFYVVGGTGPAGYNGLQEFTFKTQKWQNLTSPSMVNRTGHGVGYISSSSQILVYAGMTDGSTGSSQSTYLISTTAPYDVTSGVDQGAPALYEPILMPWSDSEIAMVGGSATNTAVHIYDAKDKKGWSLSEATLPSAIPTNSRCTIVSDSDKNIVLEEFTMNTSPNSVSSYLLSSKGKLQSPATAIGKRSLMDSYNDTLAPSNSWTNFALAQGDDMVVLSNGGGDQSLAIFNQTSNSWANTTELFYGKGDQNVLKPSTTSSITSTPTATSTTSASTSTSATATPTSTSTAAGGGGLSDHAKTILGATLGSVLGFGLILLLLLFLIRREKQKKQQQSGKGGGDSKDRFSFQDQGIEPLTEGAYPMARSPVPVATASRDSLAIVTGKYNGEKSLKPPTATGYGLSAPRQSSPLSTIPSSGAMGASSVYTDETEGGPDSSRSNQAGDRSTDEGWGKYFEDNNTTHLAGMASDRSTMSSVYTKSDYRGSAWPMSNLTPLNLGFLDQPKPLGRVHSASPTTENTSEMGGRSLVIPESQSARISTASSISMASESDRDENWQGAGHSSWLGRPSSSNYSNSFYNASTRDVPGTSSYTGLVDKARNSNVRRSSAIIPEDIDELPMQGRSNNVNSDMSWLNIHADR